MTMEIDHFNPTLKQPERNRYNNLFLATRHCNGSKSNIWPPKALRKKGIRFLNPCVEMDYGCHIFEHPVTHRLIGVTPAGTFHIITCDLNATHLIVERRDRAQIWDLIGDTFFTLKPGAIDFPSKHYALLKEQAEKMIPPIPYLSTTHPAYDEELQLVGAIFS
jgi:hypothetical protein